MLHVSPDSLRGSIISRLCQRLILEQESKFLQRPPMGLRKEQVDEDDLEDEDNDVCQEEVPANVLETNRVDEGGDSAGEKGEGLVDGKTTGSLGVGPNLDLVSYSCVSFCRNDRNGVFLGSKLTEHQSVEEHLVSGLVEEDEYNDGDVGMVVHVTSIRSRQGLLHRDSPCDKDREHTDCADKSCLDTTHVDAEADDGDRADQTPARQRQVDLLLHDRIRDSHHVEDLAEEVGNESVAGPLLEETGPNGEEGAAAHAG